MRTTDIREPSQVGVGLAHAQMTTNGRRHTPFISGFVLRDYSMLFTQV